LSRIVGCAGTSHSPLLALPPVPGWRRRAEADETGLTPLLDHGGKPRTYEELRDLAGDRYLSELDADIWEKKYQRCQEAIKRLAHDLAALSPDLIIVVGDDQEELFSPSNNPSIAIAYGPTLQSAGSDEHSEATLFRKGLGMDGKLYPGDSAAALHLIDHLMHADFDLAVVGETRQDSGFGHAFTWVLSRLFTTAVPCIPVLLNTYYPPNQPSPGRCLELGRVLRLACESLPGDRRVVIVASGGLSHFLVNLELDEAVLRAISHHDGAALAALPAALLTSGTSEVRNWITMSGASEGLKSHWTEYQPVYRTAAGTGCGLAFTVLS
jgi:Catalytic LigB subunit of aromatic ring-opening dioxygenase